MALTSLQCPECGHTTYVANDGIQQVACSSCNLIFMRDGSSTGLKSKATPAPSGLKIGARGSAGEQAFQVMGRVQYALGKPAGVPPFPGSPAGWNEWFVELAPGQTAWLTEEEGRFVIDEPYELKGPVEREKLQPGYKLTLEAGNFQIREINDAYIFAVEGGLPESMEPGDAAVFADGTDSSGKKKLTLEFDDEGEAHAYIGQTLKPTEINFAGEGGSRAGGFDCPSCKTYLAPLGDANIRTYVCPSCNSPVDMAEKTADTPMGSVSESTFLIKLGATGKLKGADWTVVGRVMYQWVQDGESGYTREYVLHNAERGYRYLGQSEEREFTFGGPVDYGPKQSFMEGKNQKVKGQEFQFLEKGELNLKYFDGGLPYAARVGQSWRYAEAGAPPHTFTELRETLADGAKGETEYSLSEDVGGDKIAGAFGLDKSSVGGSKTKTGKKPGRLEALFRWLTIPISIGFFVAAVIADAKGDVIFEQKFNAGQLFQKEVLTNTFEIKKDNEPIEILMRVGLDNEWVYGGVALYDERQQQVRGDGEYEFEYYSGYEGGEYWTEGNTEGSVFMIVPRQGVYRVLATIGEMETKDNRPVTVVVKAGVMRAYWFVILGVLWSLLGTALFIRRRMY